MKRTGLVILVLGLGISAQLALADWSSVKRLTWTSGDSRSPAIAVDSGGHIHVVWHDMTPGNLEIYHKTSSNGGATWSANQRLTWNPGYSYYPDIAIDSGDTIHVVWNDGSTDNIELLYRSSTDGGATWSPAQRITWTSGSSFHPAIAIDSQDAIHVAWQDLVSGFFEIFYKNSADSGATWSAAKRLTWTSGNSNRPAIGIAGNDAIHVAWQDYVLGNFNIYYRSSADGGATWGARRRVTWTSAWSDTPTLCTDSSNAIHMAWQDITPGNYEIYYRNSADGVSWSAAQRLTWNSGESSDPVVVKGPGDTLHLAWHDNPAGNREVYYKKSTDGGVNWSAAQRLTWTSDHSHIPAMAIDSGGAVHIVWQEDTPGKEEIYYKKGS